jgi:hypothetical protein
VLAFGDELLDLTLPGADANSALWSMRKHADLELWCTPGRRNLAVAFCCCWPRLRLRPELQRLAGAVARACRT